MNTIQKTGTASAALLLAMLTGVCGSAAGSIAHKDSPGALSPGECRISPTLVEQWVRAGEPLPPCVRQHNLALRHFADDHREPSR